MSKIKQQFLDLRKNTPRRVQWLLLAAAFTVVLILLVLLIGGDNNNNDDDATDAIPTDLVISPDMINWADTLVGQKKSETVKISATAPVNVVDVRLHENTPGLTLRDTCKQIKKIDSTLACGVYLDYAPTAVMTTKNLPVFVDWHDADETDAMKKTAKIVITLGAVAPQIEQKPAEPQTVKITEPVIQEQPEPEFEPIAYTPVKEEIKREIESIAPDVTVEPVITKNVTERTFTIPDGCSDFAFAAFDNQGRQSGWIKPSGGAYFFHTFADTNCSKPAGTYNPDNGIITDNSGKKIGTDADHIGFAAISGGVLPELSNAPAIAVVNRAQQLELDELPDSYGAMRLGAEDGGFGSVIKTAPETGVIFGTTGQNTVTSTAPYDRSFVLRQYKPIPATIVSDIRADIPALQLGVPVRATVDRNVFSDDGRNIVIPTGTLMLGYVTGEVPGPYKTIGRMQIKWYQFIRPDGVEFNFPAGSDPYSADAQGRVGVPGRGSSDYLEQFFMPMLTAFVPAAINLINPVADAFVNQIDLDNNTVVQSGTMRSSELAKNEIITAWNQVAQKLMVDMMDNTVPPFTIAAGTRITVYSPVDLQITCGTKDGPNGNKKCAVAPFGNDKRRTITSDDMELYAAQDDSWVGQSRSFTTGIYCEEDDQGLWRVKSECTGQGAGKTNVCGGHSYSTLKMYCDSLNYQSKKALQYDIYREDQQQQYQQKIEDLGGVGSQQFNQEILGVQYNTDGAVQNPYDTGTTTAIEEVEEQILCEGGTPPDANGCCPGEIYTDMGEQGFNCCPESGGDCFPPIL